MSKLGRLGAYQAPVIMGLVAAMIGTGSSVAIVIQGLDAMGATTAQIATALAGIGLSMAVVAALLSIPSRMPISIAWTTPGAALLASSPAPAGGFAEAVGAFVIAGLLLTLAGLVPWFGRLVRKIPASLANALLAGIVFSLCIAVLTYLTSDRWASVGAVLLVWAVMMGIKPLYAVPLAAVAAVVAIVWFSGTPIVLPPEPWPEIALVMPRFSLEATVSLALPLFLVTMASQNIPGLAVLRACGYEPPAGKLIAVTGLASAITAPSGAIASNLAAITAALCAGPEAGPDPAKRWVAAVTAGLFYFLFGLVATAATVVLTAEPAVITALAGLALLGTLGTSLSRALAEEADRLPAVITFVTAASGLAFLGIGAAFWALIAGAAMLAWLRFTGRRKKGP